MPDLITRDPDAVLQALRQAGACEPGSPAQTAACPAQSHCVLAGGQELCVRAVDSSVQTGVTQPTGTPEARPITELEVVSVFAVFIAGIAIGRYWPRSRKGGPAGKA
jgi:hypothetical protein